MQRERYSLEELEAKLACLNVDLYQSGGTMTVTSLESLCRRIHMIQFKIYSFRKDSKYGKE